MCECVCCEGSYVCVWGGGRMCVFGVRLNGWTCVCLRVGYLHLSLSLCETSFSLVASDVMSEYLAIVI